jgi:hypothetical protein
VKRPSARPGAEAGLFAPAAEGNKHPILAVLQRALPERGLVLEIASGTGQHVAHFAQALPALEWQPTDPDPEMHVSIACWIAYHQLANVRPPIALDAAVHPWPINRADAVVCINMIHVAPWQTTADLMAGAAGVLPAGGILFLYGPYRRFGRHTAPSNAAFDAQLRAADPRWGLRDLEAILDIAGEHGFTDPEITGMPANNHAVILRKNPATDQEGDR